MPKVEGNVIQLCEATRQGNLFDVTTLIESGVDINSQDKNGETCLHVATWNDNVTMVSAIINNGGDVNIQNKNGQTPVHLAATYGYTEVMKQLLKGDPDLNMATEYSEMTALHLASLKGHTDIVALLLRHGADPNILDVINKPPEFYSSKADISTVFEEREERQGLQRYISDIDTDLNKSMKTMSIRRPRKKIISKKLKFSQAHDKKMAWNVFDRLTRRKSQLIK